MACGKNHTLAITEDGKLYACGSNDFGQLGHNGPRTKLRINYFTVIIINNSLISYCTHCFSQCFTEPITAVDSLVMTSVACGEAHSMALNEWGQLYTWGSDSSCQLGKLKCCIYYAYFVPSKNNLIS